VFLRGIYQPLVDEALCSRMAAAAFADGNLFRLVRERNRIRMHQCVVKHDIGTAQQLGCAQRQQIGRARSCADARPDRWPGLVLFR